LLLLVGALIDVEGHGPVALDHGTGDVGDQGYVEPIKRQITEPPLIQVKGKARLADPFSWG
jgi:hypothetical protein